MRVYTAHTSETDGPVLVREGFSAWALVFGPFWLLAQRAWVAGVLALCADIAIALLPSPASTILSVALSFAIALFGRDLVRWSLSRRGYLLAHVVAARNDDEALARLLERRPDLISGAVR